MNDRKIDCRICVKIENMFGKMKDWRRIYSRYDHTFMSSIAIAASVIF